MYIQRVRVPVGVLLLAFSAAALAGEVAAADGQSPNADRSPDGGPSVVSRWRPIKGAATFDGGFTDLVELSLDASVQLKFPRPVIMTVCDDPIVEVGPMNSAVQLTATEPGVTQCGFWFEQRTAPNRFVQVTVGP